MSRGAVSQRIERLEELTALLKSGDHSTVADLATSLGVSRRTLTRDVELLRDRGVPIEGDAGRGGGIRLHRHWAVGKTSLDYREAIDALLALAIAEKLGSALFLRHLRAVRNKLAMTFPDSQREKIRLLRRRILVGRRASAGIMESYDSSLRSDVRPMHEAFFEMKGLEIVYVDEQARRTERWIDPHFLLLSWPVWYLLSWDHLRDGVRWFRIDRIHSAKVRDSVFKLGDQALFLECAGEFGAHI